jgi:hypothetical protein
MPITPKAVRQLKDKPKSAQYPAGSEARRAHSMGTRQQLKDAIDVMTGDPRESAQQITEIDLSGGTFAGRSFAFVT